MNDPLCWDSSLVKKFSSSNHYKLLNQLKNEVIKYPLNNKKKASSTQNKESTVKSQISHSQNSSMSNNSNQSKVETINKTTISFNNAKNFSIYNNNNIKPKKQSSFSDQSKSIDEYTSSTFIDRLNQIDMK